MIYNPVSTYRIQLSKEFNFADLLKIIPYLNELGVKTIYASPFFGSVPGSKHGYDITDPLMINPEIGTLEEFRLINQRLRLLGMGWIQDIVPNHMALSVHNPWIMDILENGMGSEYYDYFDIDWHHTDDRLKGRLMLPFLNEPLEKLITSGEISIEWKNRHLILKNGDNEFPLNSRAYSLILYMAGTNHLPESLIPLSGIFKTARNDTRSFKKAKEILSGKYFADNIFLDYINENLNNINRNRNLLEEIINLQHYALFCWRESATKLNYRRFFTINGLICLKIEDKRVFDDYHSFIRTLCAENLIQGIRIDHIDGLYDPPAYLERLRDLAGKDRYIVVEKIMGRNEHIEKYWPVQGETGYSFLGSMNNLLIRNKNLHLFDRIYEKWNSNNDKDFNETIYKKKQLILYHHMAGDLDNLHRYFVGLNITDLNDFESTKIKAAIGEFLLNCSFYRIYNNPDCFNYQQKNMLIRVFHDAIVKTPDLSDELLLLKDIFSGGKSTLTNKSGDINSFFYRCMQFTGPLMAKGAEDTAFYTYNRFIVNNEVGDSPDRFGISVTDFHNEMIIRQRDYPASLNASSTHDTKRGEDARARLLAISDLPESWSRLTVYWHKVNRKFKKTGDGKEIPSLNDEYFIYQTIIGFIPTDLLVEDDFEERLQKYVQKALRKGKAGSDWSGPNEYYEHNCNRFIHSILSPGTEFMTSLRPFLEKVSCLGIINSLSQTLLKFTAPGVPDIYQGSETWNFSFVDPDNRRAVDFNRLAGLLIDIKQISDIYAFIRDNLRNPRLKILIVTLLLELRNNYPQVFEKGEYIPLKVKGRFKNLLMAFARRYDGTILIFPVLLHPGSIFDNKEDAGLKIIDWEDTLIEIPDLFPGQYENLLTGGLIKSEKSLLLSSLFSEIPFCILKASCKVPEREAGILMHITSLPGKGPIGDFGPEAYNFADFMKSNGLSYWQMLPLNQVYKKCGYSPYSPLSAFAGNVLLISAETLAEQNLISTIPENSISSSPGKADYQLAELLKETQISSAYNSFKNSSRLALRKDFDDFREKEKYWLSDYCLFVTIKKKYSSSGWDKWPEKFRDRDVKALGHFYKENSYNIEREEFAQFIFLQQWKALKSYCNNRGIKIFGDIPVYVNYDSADVWSHPEYFKLTGNKKMLTFGGVPPDYFSSSGQNWKMPVFRWNIMKKDGFEWWKNRIRKNLELFDLLRLDHFRGFSAFWEIPGNEVTAINGKWTRGPGNSLFEELKKEFPEMPFVAEDLGEIDQAVYDLRDKYNLPGMKVLQFAFGADTSNSVHIPHRHIYNSVVYTGTHDNNTIKGWYTGEADPVQRRNLQRYIGKIINGRNVHLELIRMAYSSVAKLVIIPAQDFLGLDNDARMNTPSVENDNWIWRLQGKDINSRIGKKIKTFVKTYGRI